MIWLACLAGLIILAYFGTAVFVAAVVIAVAVAAFTYGMRWERRVANRWLRNPR